MLVYRMLSCPHLNFRLFSCICMLGTSPYSVGEYLKPSVHTHQDICHFLLFYVSCSSGPLWLSSQSKTSLVLSSLHKWHCFPLPTPTVMWFPLFNLFPSFHQHLNQGVSICPLIQGSMAKSHWPHPYTLLSDLSIKTNKVVYLITTFN